MDVINLKIIDLLKENSRSSTSEISKKVNLSIPAVAERIRKLEETAIIEKYTIKINRKKMNCRILAFILIGIDKSENIESFREAVHKHNCILECHHIAGEYDYLLKVAVEDTESLENFLSNALKKIKGVFKSNTIITLSSLKEEMNT